MVKRLLAAVLVCLAAASSSGCFFITTLGREFIDDVSEFVDAVFTAIDTHATIGICTTVGGTVSCQYFVNGVPISSTATMASELGIIAGAIADPTVVQLPAAATNIAGTFDDGAGHSGNLLVYPNLLFVPVDDTHRLEAETGKQLVILDLPASAVVVGRTYHTTLDFKQLVPNGTGPTQVKALFTAKLTVNGKTYYPPMLPCTSNTALLPAINIPRSTVLEPLTLPTATPCPARQAYFYFRAESGPPRSCDLDNDHDVDVNDVNLVMAMRNQKVHDGDPRDITKNNFVNADDGRACTVQCSRARCQA
jgi:hypothetical protein